MAATIVRWLSFRCRYAEHDGAVPYQRPNRRRAGHVSSSSKPWNQDVSYYRALISARKPRAGRYAQSSEPRPRGTSFAGERCRAISVACYAVAAAVSSRRQRNSLSSAHMRCRITASLRATATVARRRPRRLAIPVPQAFSVDHRVTRVSRLCAAINSASRANRSPLLLIAPLRSISPEAYLRGVSPRCAPTSRDSDANRPPASDHRHKMVIAVTVRRESAR